MYFRQQEKNYLAHHGIKGQKWGVRRFQNEDGSLTEEGRKRYGYGTEKKGKEHNTEETGIKTVKEREIIKKSASKKWDEYDKLADAAEETDDDELWDKANAVYQEAKYMEKGITPKEMKYINDMSARMYNGPHYDEKSKKIVSGSKSFDSMIDQSEKIAKDIYEKNKNIKYGSKEWFDAREELYKEQEKLEKKYMPSILKDFDINTKDPVIKKEIFKNGIKELLFNSLAGNAWYSDEYASIADPWGFSAGDRDYGLEEKAAEYYNNKRSK